MTSERIKVEKMDELIHPSVRWLFENYGRGWYEYFPLLGFSQVFFLAASGIVPQNPPQIRSSSTYHDQYDILRAIETGRVRPLVYTDMCERPPAVPQLVHPMDKA